MIELIKDLWLFMRERKKWWLLPLIVFLLFMGLLIAAGSTSVAPFIYTLF